MCLPTVGMYVVVADRVGVGEAAFSLVHNLPGLEGSCLDLMDPISD